MLPLSFFPLPLNWQTIGVCVHVNEIINISLHPAFFVSTDFSGRIWDRSGSWFHLYWNLWHMSKRLSVPKSCCAIPWMILKLNRQDHKRQSGYYQKIQLLKFNLFSKPAVKNLSGSPRLRLSGRAPQRPIWPIWICNYLCNLV